MSTDDPTTTVVPTPTTALLSMADFIASLPSVDDDPTPRMMEAVFNSPDAASWEDVFTAEHFKESAGKKVRIHTFRPLRSRYQGRFPWYLVCDITWLDTGENTVLTVGSQMAMAQLLNCWRRDDLPHDFEIVTKDRPTEAGFYPMRLRSIRSRVDIEAGR